MGGSDREVFAAEFARRHADLNVWVSTGSSAKKVEAIFEAMGISLKRLLNLDYRSGGYGERNLYERWRGVSAAEIRHVYLLTSDFNMRGLGRSSFFVLGVVGGITYNAG